MFIKIFLFVFSYPLLPIMYFIMKNELDSHKNIIIGVTLPHEQLRNPDVVKIVAKTKKSMKRITLVLALIPLISFFINYESITFALYLTWLTVACFIYFIPFAKANIKLHNLKKEHGWHVDEEDTTVIDLKVSLEEPNPLKKYWFLPALVLTLIPIIIDLCTKIGKEDFLFSLLTTASIGFVTFLCPIFFHISYRGKQEIVSRDSLKNQTLTRIRRYNWGKCWIATAYTNAIYTILFWLYINHHIENIIVFLTITLFYTLFVLWWVLRADFKVRLAQRQFSIQTDESFTVDEDIYWPYGLCYYNPNDKHLLVHNRVGMATDINLAKPIGKVIMILVALMLLLIPISGVGMILSQFSQIELTLDEDSITGKHLYDTYDVTFNEIQSIETWDTLPDTSKENGTGFSNLLKGRFSIAGNGTCTVCLNPENHLYIVITKVDGKKCVFSGATDEDTVDIYNKLLEQIR
ncbi:DUF5808 domain-containing protein [Anaerosporobacter sp.]|uniref:DUF5808 domain-containing protein n=1 Tax=Anaerosporobacter sp. TaxID=1872529 RepID=UPI00286F167B|nr:DUF5808 domain-containing protein [Anaerosporobacter sp.]